MATYRDPVRCFAPFEVLERLLEIRAEAGFAPAVYLLSLDDLADYLDAFGFDVYALSESETGFTSETITRRWLRAAIMHMPR